MPLDADLTALALPSFATVYIVMAMAFAFSAPSALLGKDAPPIIQLFSALGPAVAVGMWFRRYARQAGQSLVHDWGFFYWISWPVLIPVYALKIDRRRGWALTGRLAALIFAPRVAAVLLRAIWGR